MLLEGRTAVVTGAGSGIGSLIAVALAKQGANVHACSRSDSAKWRAAEARADGLTMTAASFDLDDDAAIAAAAQTILAASDRLDILVHCAGINIPGGIDAVEASDCTRMFRINVTAPMILTRLLLPGLRRSQHARVISIGSWVGRTPAPGYVAYSATKAALLSFTRGASMELAADGITVNAVCPGNVWTPIWGATDEPERARAAYESAVARQPLPRGVEPSEIAAAVVFLAGDGAGSITGEALYVASGL